MSATAIMCSATLLLAILLFGAFLWLTRAKKCPRCGNKTWVPLKHKGPFVVYCSNCAYAEDMATGRPA